MKRLKWSSTWLLVSLFARLSVVHAQGVVPSPAPTAEPLGIYIDCNNIVCDSDFLRTEIAFVTHVRDRRDADVHVLIAAQPTAAGGSEATLTLIGQKAFDGLEDTVRYVSGPADTQDQTRRGLAEAVKRGLVRYVNRTPLAERLTVVFAPSEAPMPASVRDPWNHWTFSATGQGAVNGEQSVNSTTLGLSTSANRTTDEWKIGFSLYTQYNSTSFDLGDARRIASVQRSRAFSALVVNSVGDRLSVGGRGSVSSSSFLNQALTMRIAPAVEYNLFPFSESSSRMLTIEYSVGVTAFDYAEETIFRRHSETLLDQRVLASMRFTQPWGSATVGAEASHYLQDVSKHRGVFFGDIDWNLGKGLSLVTLANVQRIADQVFLPARGASEEEILLRQRQLATSYSYSLSIGLSYRFGSPYADVVNRRFVGSVGGVSLVQ